MINKNYSHISFDLWLTIIQSNPYYKQKRNQLLIDFFELNLPIETVNKSYNKFDKTFNYINEVTGGNLDATAIWYIFLADVGVEIHTVNAATLQLFIDKTELLFFEYPPTLLDENTSLLFKSLTEEGITLSLLSNTAFTKGIFLKKLLVQLSIDSFFSFKLFSDEIGYSKPNPLAYQTMYQNVLSLKPTIEKHQILHVGDNPIADLQGAENFGIHGKLLLPNMVISHLFK